jgi:hypothetical protein
MSSSPAPPGPPVRPRVLPWPFGRRSGTRFSRGGGRSWSQEIETTTAALRMRLEMIRSRRPPAGASEAERTAICSGVEILLSSAERAARGEEPQYGLLRSWWRGTSIEAAFRKSHQAEAELAKMYADAEVEAEVPAAVARTQLALNRDDPMREAACHLIHMPPGPGRRLLLAKVIQVGHEAADGAHTRIRNFRNILLSTTGCIAVLVLAFSLVVAAEPTSVPLCFQPQDSDVACPTGDGPDQEPGALDVVVVAMLGLLGGSLAGAVSIRNLRGTSTPYDIPIALALLKVPAGALTAIGALIAIRGEFVPGLSALDSQEQILAYALIFGYAQQLLTGLIDRQALGLLDSVPSKDVEQSRPPLPASSPPAPWPAGTPNGQPTVIPTSTHVPDTGAPAP